MTDRKRNQISNLVDSEWGVHFKPEKSIYNGKYQHIFWLGIHGYVLVNHVDKEILVVDPWPTAHSDWNKLSVKLFADNRPHKKMGKSDKKRLSDLANFLRAAVMKKYKLSGILLSHMHYDHADDTVLLLELMHMQKDTKLNHQGMEFDLEGDAVADQNLPKIFTDRDTFIYIKTHWFGKSVAGLPDHYWAGKKEQVEFITNHGDLSKGTEEWKHLRALYTNTQVKWHIIRSSKPGYVYYNDYFNKLSASNKRTKAGIPLTPFDAGNFHIEPYAWDHMNIGRPSKKEDNAIKDQASGSMQRISAFNISRKSTKSTGQTKRTMLVGSAGEMNKKWTKPLADTSAMPQIETDMLVQAVAGTVFPLFADFAGQDRLMWHFSLGHINVKDFVVLSHWENFVTRISNKDELIHEDFDIIKQNVKIIKKLLSNYPIPSPNNKMFARKSVFILNRRGYEETIPADPGVFKTNG